MFTEKIMRAVEIVKRIIPALKILNPAHNVTESTKGKEKDGCGKKITTRYPVKKYSVYLEVPPNGR